MSASSSSPIIKRPKRRGLPKRKTGCRTCKQRRVKCGEERPFCSRCVKFGVQCDGYGVLENPASLPGRDRKSLILPKALVKPPLWQENPSTSPFNVEQEYRYFDIFCNKTAFDILPNFETYALPLRQVILQTCESEPSIRHAVVALGALDLAAGGLQDFSRLSLDAGKATPLKHHQNALKQYTTAIREMRLAAASKKQDLRTTLLTCLVILCFEAWNGNQDLAVKQIQTGFRLIQAWREETLDERDERRFVGLESSVQDTVEDELVRVFQRLDVQAISFTNESTPERHALVLNGERSLLDRMPQVFTSVQDANTYENALIRQTMRFFSEQIPLPIPPPPRVTFPMHGWWGIKIPIVVAIQQRIMTDIIRWKTAFEPLWQCIRAEGNAKDYSVARIVHMHIQTLWIGLITICMDDEGQFDDHLDVFCDIIEIAEFSLDLENGISRAPKFQFDSLVVIPLYMVSFKCRDPGLRRRAIRMLLDNPRREGVWDSVLGGKMGEWAMSVEEEFMEDEKVPIWARIHWVSLERDREQRSAMLTCEQRVGPESEEVVVRRKIITW